ncbi:hypothetical protein BA184_06400 [Helicobacter pullorum]|uniref:hypothetical protein n=1 Tax=Helicobacter pullorum TaxID=35818 RepID=UPI0008169C64|nr:hypothetical protein [Helicobacter pullorum]OCR03065.1 hypothetical protein BA729_08450 [Helicobacter pullorum]OCR08442.1 hypothetical protein BA185_00430 [Helicobacter pullorum]OCR09576.1 hypothetical protein BA184_06400 [Helicobacter pullorum]
MKIVLVILSFIAFLFAEDKDSLEQGLKFSSENNQTFPFEMAKSPLESINFYQYSGVILVLIGLLILLWYIKKRLYYKEQKLSLVDFFKKKEANSIQIVSSFSLSMNAKLVVFEIYQKRYIVILSQNGATLVDKYSIKDFGELLEQEKQ